MRRFKKFLRWEIEIGFKACQYFFMIFFYYAVYRMLGGSREADIAAAAEIIMTAYIMCYAQVYLLRNFDESEYLGRYETAAAAACSMMYGAVSFAFGWFEREIAATALFVLYMLVCYLVMFLCYHIRRRIDTRQLNLELEEYKRGRREHERKELCD